VASIDKRPNGRYRARWREYPGGPQRAKHFDRRVDAQLFLDQVRGDLVRGTYVDPVGAQVPFGRYAESWRQAQAHHRPSTAALVETYLRRHIVPYFGSRPLGSIRPSEVQSWANDRPRFSPPRRSRSSTGSQPPSSTPRCETASSQLAPAIGSSSHP
jgi:hypothetical protein